MKLNFYKLCAFAGLCLATALPFTYIAAQSITFDNVPPLSGGGNTAGGVCFNFTTNQAIIVENLRCAFSTATGTANIWYNPTKINGQPTISAANGWVNLGTATFAGQSPATTSPVVQTIPVALNLPMMPNDTFGFAIQWTGNVYPTTNTNIPVFTDGTVSIIADASCAYTFNSGMTSFFTPRQINGGVIYSIAGVDNDAGADSLLSPTGVFCSGQQDLMVRIANKGTNQINNLNVNWSLNGVLQSPIAYNNTLNPLGSASNTFADINLGIVDLPFGSGTNVKVWTSMPNGVPDANTDNDTLSFTLVPEIQGVTVNIQPGDTTLCAGETLVLDAGQQPPNTIFIWNTGALTQSINVQAGGIYHVKVQSAGGCVDRDTVQINFSPQPAAQAILITQNTPSNYTFNVFAPQSILYYSWDYGDGSPTELSPGPVTHEYAIPGEYMVSLTIGNVCDTVVLQRPVLVPDPASISQLENKYGISAYPNPAEGKVYINNTQGIAIRKVALYAINGTRIFSREANRNTSEMDLSGIAAGIYQLVFTTDQGTFAQKLQLNN